MGEGGYGFQVGLMQVRKIRYWAIIVLGAICLAQSLVANTSSDYLKALSLKQALPKGAVALSPLTGKALTQFLALLRRSQYSKNYTVKGQQLINRYGAELKVYRGDFNHSQTIQYLLESRNQGSLAVDSVQAIYQC